MSEPQTTSAQPKIIAAPSTISNDSNADSKEPGAVRWRRWICAIPISTTGFVLICAFLTQSALIGGSIFGIPAYQILRPVDLGNLPHLAGLTPAQIHGIDTARIGWVSAAFLHAIVCIGTIVSGLWIIFYGHSAKLQKPIPGNGSNGNSKISRWNAITQSGVVALLASAAISVFIVTYTHHKIADEVISIITTSEANASALHTVVFALNCLTFTSAIFLISLGAIMLYTPKPYLQWIYATDNQEGKPAPGNNQENQSDPSNDITHYMAAQSQECKVIFYFGAAVLVTAIIRLHAFFGWAISYYPRESGVDATGLRHLLESIATTWGIFATLLLLAMYLPIYITLRHRSFHLVHRCQHGECRAKHRKWLKRNGFVTSNAQLLSKAAAMLSPFLVGQASELFKGI